MDHSNISKTAAAWILGIGWVICAFVFYYVTTRAALKEEKKKSFYNGKNHYNDDELI